MTRCCLIALLVGMSLAPRSSRDGGHRHADAGARMGAARASDPGRRACPACREFFEKYYDARGYLQAFLRWGANDGPDDAFENFNRWPELHALGGDDEILRLYLTAGEGMIRQYSEAKTTDVPAGREWHVREGVLRAVRLDAPRRGPAALQPHGAVGARPPGLSRPRAALRGALHGRGPGRAELRPGQEADPLDDQRQPRPDAAAGDGARLGRRPVRYDGLRRAARREHLRAVPRALPGIHRRRAAITS